MKRLTITYGDVVIHDADCDEFQWTDAEGYVAVTAKAKAAKATPAGAGLLEMITQASRRKTEAVIKRTSEPIAEPAPVANITEPKDDL